MRSRPKSVPSLLAALSVLLEITFTIWTTVVKCFFTKESVPAVSACWWMSYVVRNLSSLWLQEPLRDYYLLELVGGAVVEVYTPQYPEELNGYFQERLTKV